MIFSWWEVNRRDLPWRDTRDPYHILISEIMLQQTQVSRGLPKYLEFLKTFPTVFDLASASVGDVLRIWKGMGYNRRALFLQKTAIEIVDTYKGIFPKEEKKLLALPGIGKYTARAMMVFAFELDVTMIDTNIREIIRTHFFGGKQCKETEIEKVAIQLLPTGNSWAWHEALMDYGALALDRTKNEEKGKKSVPFKDTNRFIRGRIMDAVRERIWKKKELVKYIECTHHKDKEKISMNIEALMNEHLLENEKNHIQLPK